MISLLAFLLPVAPLLALLVALLLGYYPGHETIVRLSERLTARSRRPFARAASPARPRWAPCRTPHGGLLLAHSLSGRAPPA
ncbi:MAG TPA: hypothetical protein VGO66_11460 [Solirubrobacterales bacterium]|jgi:hypothetical protein|nr:hypothetical protein [Solirubrobacterales bacterium]